MVASKILQKYLGCPGPGWIQDFEKRRHFAIKFMVIKVSFGI
jgi:hypothetical protein